MEDLKKILLNSRIFERSNSEEDDGKEELEDSPPID